MPVDPNVNDENIAQLDPVAPAVDSVDYVSSEDLKPLSDPDVKFQGLIEGLESKDWLKICDSLNDVRRMVEDWPHVSLIPRFDTDSAMKNPRSALCKTSIMAASDIFKSYDPNVNDESIAHLDHVAPAVDYVDYVSSEDLKPLSDPDVKFQLHMCLSSMKTDEYEYMTRVVNIEGEKVLLVLVKAMKNPRSALCKTSIMAASDIFKSYGDKLLESITRDAVDHMVEHVNALASELATTTTNECFKINQCKDLLSIFTHMEGKGFVGFSEDDEESKKRFVQNFYHGCF
ncbi:unnamed protein product [Lactuca virosa]|uniref:TOG domain-containing protein n=1 Tax=Lactuca virosa TaxID=75947 RepID=A0AAU9N5A1_9ASTR|nr:unnamed protein product [Lactuca virosa]